MKNRNKYYGLDEIGFVGVQGKEKEVQLENDIAQTIKYIKDKKAGKIRTSRVSKRIRTAKAK